MNVHQILTESPDIPGYGGGKWAMYSMGCCWWTSFPEDLGRTGSPIDEMIIVSESGNETAVTPPSFPCCPHCGSLLMQAPLLDFIKQAHGKPNHFGEGGIDTFIAAHHRNSSQCYERWHHYEQKNQ